MDNNELADQLQSALDAFTKLPKSQRDREALQLRAINTGIRSALKALGEDAHEVETLEARGLWLGQYNNPIPDSYIPGVEQLISDLRS